MLGVSVIEGESGTASADKVGAEVVRCAVGFGGDPE